MCIRDRLSWKPEPLRGDHTGEKGPKPKADPSCLKSAKDDPFPPFVVPLDVFLDKDDAVGTIHWWARHAWACPLSLALDTP